MPDLMRMRISGWLKAASTVEAYNLKFSTPISEVSSAFNDLTPTAHWLEWVDWANQFCRIQVQGKNEIHIPEVPGTGIEWNEYNIEKYKIDIQ